MPNFFQSPEGEKVLSYLLHDCLDVIGVKGHGWFQMQVAWWLELCASNRKVAGSNPRADKVNIYRSAPEQGSLPTVPMSSLKLIICS